MSGPHEDATEGESAADAGAGGSTWIVWRQDDHGNEAQVATGLTRARAEELVEEFTARGHKQVYWVAQVDAT